MSEVTVSLNLSRKAQGELYMRSLRQADRINELKAALRKISNKAIAYEAFEIKLIADAALQPPKKDLS